VQADYQNKKPLTKNGTGKDIASSSNLSQSDYTTGPDEEGGDNEVTENLMKPGTKISINDFQLLKVIGRGSFGKVYLVRKKDSGLPYAMKILKKDQLIKKNLLIKTQAERDILEKIKNPYIVGLHFAFQTETKLYFVIDFLNGGELFTYLRKDRQFNEQRAKIYAAEMVEALGVLH
jgi:serum/glucocorticoid-regulated kinase 2